MFSTAQRVGRLKQSASVAVAGVQIVLTDHVKSLDVTFDSHLSFDKHQQHLSCMLFPHSWIATCPFCYGNRYRKNRCMRYCHFPTRLLQRTTRRDVRIQLDKLQRVQITLTCVVTGLRRRDHIIPALKELHWLPIRARITFKVATAVYRLRKRRQTPYLADLISDYIPTRTL